MNDKRILRNLPISGILYLVMLATLFSTGCNKYEDDFKQINTKLDALSSQKAGVTTLGESVAAAKATLPALTTAVAALPSGDPNSALSAEVTTIASTINSMPTISATTDVDVSGAVVLSAGVALNNVREAQTLVVAGGESWQPKKLTSALATTAERLQSIIDIYSASGVAYTSANSNTLKALKWSVITGKQTLEANVKAGWPVNGTKAGPNGTVEAAFSNTPALGTSVLDNVIVVTVIGDINGMSVSPPLAPLVVLPPVRVLLPVAPPLG